jgi:two-component system, sensor histidine kinase PdtaS
MRKLPFVFLLVCFWSKGMSQDTRSAQTLNLVINDGHGSSGNRVLACVRQGEYYINKPGRTPEDLDSASLSLKQGELLSKQFGLHEADGELLFLQALICKQKGQREEGNKLNDLALTYLRKKPGDDFLGRALLEKGDYLNSDDDKQYEKIALLKDALTCFDSPGYVKTRAAVWKMLGDMYQQRHQIAGNVGLALAAYQRSMDTYFSFGYRNVQDIYIEMGEMYLFIGDNSQALRYCLLAAQTAERSGDSSHTLCEIDNYTGITYLVLLDYANAEKYFLQALDLAGKWKDEPGTYMIEENLFTTYRRSKQYKKIVPFIDHVRTHFSESDLQNKIWANTFYLSYCNDIRDVEKGKKYAAVLQKLLKESGSEVFPDRAQSVYGALSYHYGVAHDFKNAYRYWDSIYATVRRYYPSVSSDIARFKDHFQLDTASHHLDSAVLYLLRSSNLRDSSFTASKAAQEANLKVLFETQKKEYELAESKQEINILTQNQHLQQANLKQAVFMRDITIGFTILVIIVSLLLYRMVRLYRKAVKKTARTNATLEKLVSEKEWLLKEIHHRVKNNLHTVICLLESQSAYLEEDALRAVEESRRRIYAMSLIHQKLYEHDDVKTINMSDYVNALVAYLQDCFDLKNRIAFQLEIAPVSIDTSIAIPLGLLINEAVTNAIKYAFVNRDNGRITIRFFGENDKIVLVIADNGVGIDAAYLNNPTQSMGLRLIKGLTGDIGGTISFNTLEGTEIRLVCPRVLVEDPEQSVEELLNNIPNAM